MAKAREITGLDCSKRSLAWVSKVLITRFDEMAEFRHAATGFAEIKGVHDMRVAARRLRSALRDIAPFLQKEPLKDIRKELKVISDVLGAVRDRDVAIGLLNRLAGEIDGEAAKRGIAKLVEENTDARNAARLDVTAVIADDKIENLRKRFTSALKDSLADSDKLRFSDASARMVKNNLGELLDLSPRLYKPFKRNGLHKLRIACKRLRYSLELAALCHGPEAKKVAKEISRMQDLLGELHDCDIWIEDLGKRLADEYNDERAAASAMLPLFVRKQNKEYLAALALWEEWLKNNFAEGIEKVVSLA